MSKSQIINKPCRTPSFDDNARIMVSSTTGWESPVTLGIFRCWPYYTLWSPTLLRNRGMGRLMLVWLALGLLT